MDKIQELYLAEEIEYTMISGAKVEIFRHPEGWSMTVYEPYSQKINQHNTFSDLEKIIEVLFGWESSKIHAMFSALSEWGAMRLSGDDYIREHLIEKMNVVKRRPLLSRLAVLDTFDYDGLGGYYVISRNELDDVTWYYSCTGGDEDNLHSKHYKSLEELIAVIAKLEKTALCDYNSQLVGWANIPEYTENQIQGIIMSKLEASLH